MNELSEFIKTHVEEINNNDFTEVYEDANNQLKNSSSVGKLTELFLDAGIDPLKYMQNVPTHYIHYASKVNSIVIPDSVTSIGDYAFEGCSGLTSVTIGNNVTSIGRRIFTNCNNLKEITFNGTVKQWNAIKKASMWNHGVPENIKIICKDGEVVNTK